MEGATHYNIYWDDFFPAGCDESENWCELLVSGYTETRYVHTLPDTFGITGNYYWVVACNSYGCSPVDTLNPATPD